MYFANQMEHGPVLVKFYIVKTLYDIPIESSIKSLKGPVDCCEFSVSMIWIEPLNVNFYSGDYTISKVS